MAQLPPKIPTMAPACWSEFGGGHHHHHQRSPSAGTFLAAPMPPPQQQPSWVDEFLDFSSAKRRRSVAFLEPGPDDDGNGCGGVGAHDLDRLDYDQLMSMFSDDLPPPQQQQAAPAPVASSSSPSDHNSINDDKTGRGETTEEAQSMCHGNAAAAAAVDPKRVKR
jgi:cyclic AMP-dependent transcription factor ATF-4